jgi:molybdenum cofactor synthesis domain-containing protein
MTDTAADAVVTAALLVIGDEILSGRTKDRNIGFIAEYCTNIGVDLKEVRVVPDEEPEIVDALNALRRRYDYVFTTGGIGPTHDDITADAVAKAFGVGIDIDQRVVDIMLERFKREDLNESRLRMARIPFGADLVMNSYNKVPGFWIGNVVVMAGVPAIMQAMFEGVAPKLRAGRRMLSTSILADMKEGDIGAELAAVAKAHPAAMIGSYPHWDAEGKPNTSLVVRAREETIMNAAADAVRAMLAAKRAGA